MVIYLCTHFQSNISIFEKVASFSVKLLTLCTGGSTGMVPVQDMKLSKYVCYTACMDYTNRLRVVVTVRECEFSPQPTSRQIQRMYVYRIIAQYYVAIIINPQRFTP